MLNIQMPEWLNTWFAIFPTIESLAAQSGAAALVLGSYFFARAGIKTVKTNFPTNRVISFPITQKEVLSSIPAHQAQPVLLAEEHPNFARLG
jgi:hypothetical protein